MNNNSNNPSQPASMIPPDDLRRNLALARPNEDRNLHHIGVVGDAYTILLTGEDTAGRYCLIDMYVPPGGGPPPHRHDFEESFTILEGEIEVAFRGVKSVLRAGETVNIPANAPVPQQIRTTGAVAVHLLACRSGRVFYGSRRSRRQPDNDASQARRVRSGGVQSEIRSAPPKYRTELLKPE